MSLRFETQQLASGVSENVNNKRNSCIVMANVIINERAGKSQAVLLRSKNVSYGKATSNRIPDYSQLNDTSV